MKARIPGILVVLGLSVGALTPAMVGAQTPPVTTGAVAVGQGKAVATETTKVSAVVVGIDSGTRVVTLKTAKGDVVNVTAGEQVRNFAQIRIGDTVTAEYTRALSLELKKGGAGAARASQQDAAARAAAGDKPGAAVGRQVTILADVVALDPKTQVVRLRGPQGNFVDLKVQDPEQFKHVKKGDQVEAVYTEALAVAVEAKPAGK